MVQKMVTSGHYLQFPEIPEEIRENFTETSAISVKLQQNFEQICKIMKHLRKSEDFEM